MSTLDLVVIAGYFLIVFAIGFYFTSRAKTSKGYFLADRSVGWIAVGTSLFASNISSEHFIGLAGSGAGSGLAVGHFEWLATFMCLMLGWFFVPFYMRSSVVTMPEFLERRYGSSCRWYLTTVTLLAYVFTKISVALYAGALLLKAVAGWDFYTSAILMVVATGAYTILGGLSAVIYTELLQAAVLLTGAFILTVIGMNEVGGFAGLRAALPADHFHMMKPITHPDFPWTGIFLGAPILGIWYWCTDQVHVQRVLGAKSEGDARAGAIFCGLLKVTPVFVLVLPGMIARALYPDIVGDDAYPTLVLRMLPSGLIGVMVAALMAALMSSLAATFNSSSTLITFDFYKKFNPNASERQLVRVGRISTVVMVILGVSWVPFISGMSSQVYVYLQSVQAYVSPPITAVFLLGILWPRANRQGAIAALIVGAVIGGTRFVLEVMKHSPFVSGSPALSYFVAINFLHIAVIIFIISVIVLVAVSLATAEESMAKLRGLTFSTLEGGYGFGSSAAALRKHAIVSVTLAAFVIGLWIWFA
jgi:SSS family solute:Na+ symporter